MGMTPSRRLHARHFILLAVVFAAGVLLGANVLLPVHVRFPGLVVLVLLAAWLLFARDDRARHGPHAG
jgi:hypothetical protein